MCVSVFVGGGLIKFIYTQGAPAIPHVNVLCFDNIVYYKMHVIHMFVAAALQFGVLRL